MRLKNNGFLDMVVIINDNDNISHEGLECLSRAIIVDLMGFVKQKIL